MKEEIQKTADKQAALLSRYEREAEILRVQYEKVHGQSIMQNIFVTSRDLWQVAQTDGRVVCMGRYGDKEATIEISDCVEGNTSDVMGVNVSEHVRLTVCDRKSEIILCDVSLTRPQDDESWEAMICDYPTPVTRKTGHSQANWRKASGLITGENQSPAGLAPEAHQLNQMLTTIKLKDSGSLSLFMLAIQSPGGFVNSMFMAIE